MKSQCVVKPLKKQKKKIKKMSGNFPTADTVRRKCRGGPEEEVRKIRFRELLDIYFFSCLSCFAFHWFYNKWSFQLQFSYCFSEGRPPDLTFSMALNESNKKIGAESSICCNTNGKATKKNK